MALIIEESSSSQACKVTFHHMMLYSGERKWTTVFIWNGSSCLPLFFKRATDKPHGYMSFKSMIVHYVLTLCVFACAHLVRVNYVLRHSAACALRKKNINNYTLLKLVVFPNLTDPSSPCHIFPRMISPAWISTIHDHPSLYRPLLSWFCSAGSILMPSFLLYAVSCCMFCVMLLPHQIGCCSPAEFVFGV